MSRHDVVTLTNGELRLTLAPSIGAAVTGFWLGGVALMRETPDEAVRGGLVRQTSCYPLIPYSNRIAHGRFKFDGQEYRLPLNFGDHPHSIHGNAWQSAWEVADRSEASCRLVLKHCPTGEDTDAWPFAYRAEQTVRLKSRAASIHLSVTNEGRRSMPTGLGLHPFFPRRKGTLLQFAAGGVHRNGDDSLPLGREAIPAEWDFRTLRAMEPGLDNCFAGWNGRAEIRYENPGLAITIEADPVFGHLVVYVPQGRDFFAIEPVTHLNDAVNRLSEPDHGLRVLDPGETLSGRVIFHPERLAR